MKKGLLILLTLFLLSGCTVTKMNDYSYEQVIDKVLSLDINIYNKVGKGYKYYAPKGVVLKDSNTYNDVLVSNKNVYYLYVDVVSYYYKTPVNYKKNNDVYFSKLINHDGKKGYVEIRKSKGKLYVEMFYNYAKIETYVDESDLNNVMLDLSYILSSIDFNDSLLKKMYESGTLGSKEEVYKLFDNKEKKGNFLEYIEEFDKYEGDEGEITEEQEIKVETTTTTKEETTTSKKEEIVTSSN